MCMNSQGNGHDRDWATRPQTVPSRGPARPNFPETFHREPANGGHDRREHIRKIVIPNHQKNETFSARNFAEKNHGTREYTFLKGKFWV